MRLQWEPVLRAYTEFGDYEIIQAKPNRSEVYFQGASVGEPYKGLQSFDTLEEAKEYCEQHDSELDR